MTNPPFVPFAKGAVLLVEQNGVESVMTVDTDLGGTGFVALDDEGQQFFVWRGNVKSVRPSPVKQD